jgi:hypothetical protein
MSDSLLVSTWSRRHLILGGLGAGALAATTGSASTGPGSALDLSTPQARLRVFRKLQGSEVDGEASMMHYSGVTFGSVAPAQLEPLYGMEGLTFLRSFLQPDGSVRWLANEVAVFTDLSTGEVLDQWRNPYTDEVVDVWHLRNGPLNYSVSPTAEMTGGWRLLRPIPEGASGFYVPASVVGDKLIVTVDGQASRRNPLSPEEWPRESSGERLVYSEHNTWVAPLAGLASRDVPSPEITGAWHSLKPWRAWMLMGTTPGHIYSHLVARKIASLDEAPRAVVNYVRRAFPEFLSAPAEWTGSYRDDWSYFKEQRKPRPARGA